MTNSDMLPRVQTKKEFHECLESWISPPKRENDEELGGRLRELRSYVLETNGGYKKEGLVGSMKWSIGDTGVDKLKILHVEYDGSIHEAFMETSDSRFCVLHTNERSEITSMIVDMFTDGWSHSFDRMWMHHSMLEAVVKKAGNSFMGFGAKYSDELHRKAEEDGSASEIEDINLTINGSMASKIEQIMHDAERLKNAIAYNKLRIMRGEADNPDKYASDDVTSMGYFAMKHGKSVLDHLDLVRISKDMYANVVSGIEEYRLGARQADGKHIVKGKTIDVIFKKPIPDLQLFIRRVFSAAKPFRLWGLESKLEDGYFDVLGVDLHTSDPMNFEITEDFMRIYLSEGSCGNTVLRLLTNLQQYYGRGIACERVDQLVR